MPVGFWSAPCHPGGLDLWVEFGGVWELCGNYGAVRVDLHGSTKKAGQENVWGKIGLALFLLEMNEEKTLV